jgi:hypothetical protein
MNADQTRATLSVDIAIDTELLNADYPETEGREPQALANLVALLIGDNLRATDENHALTVTPATNADTLIEYWQTAADTNHTDAQTYKRQRDEWHEEARALSGMLNRSMQEVERLTRIIEERDATAAEDPADCTYCGGDGGSGVVVCGHCTD